jgi:hypothetical protein
MNEAALTTEQLARRWGVKPSTIRGHRYRGTGPKFAEIPRLGRPVASPKVLYPLHDVLAFEEANGIVPVEP